jgi:methyltransferase
MRSCLLALLCAERLLELALSRRNTARLRARGALEHGRSHTRVMIGFHAAVLAGCALERRRRLPRAATTCALATLALGQLLRYAAIATLGAHWSIRVLTLPGAPAVTTGPYRFVRHPNYLGVLLETTALPLACGALGTAAFATLVNPILLAIRIAVEERALGAPYQAAFAARGRLLPWRRRDVASRSAGAG